jgi:hypothetical protein
MTKVRIRTYVIAGALALAAAGGAVGASGAASAHSGAAAAAAPSTTARTGPWQLPGGATDAAHVQRLAGQFMGKAATVHAVRGNAAAVRALLFRGNEGPQGDNRFGNSTQVLIIRIDGSDNLDLRSVPVPPGHKYVAQQAVIIVADLSGRMISAVTVPEGDSAAAARFNLATFGTVVPVDVPTAKTLPAQIKAAEASK